LTYVGSAESEKYDQTLDAVYVGPVAPGQYRFIFQADPPNFSALPSSDIVGVTIVLLTCSYKNQEFLRVGIDLNRRSLTHTLTLSLALRASLVRQVGYYVNNEYLDEGLREEPPAVPVLDKLVRSILSDKPRVTKYPIDWEGNGIVAVGGGAADMGAGASGSGAAEDGMVEGEAGEAGEGGEGDEAVDEEEEDEGDISDEGAAMMED